MSGATFAPAIVAAARRKMINRFRKAGAISADTAQTAQQIGLRRMILFHRLLRIGVIVAVDDKYYLDEQRLAEYRLNRRIILVPIIGLMLVIMILIMLFGK